MGTYQSKNYSKPTYIKKVIHWDKDNDVKVYNYTELSIVISSQSKWGKENNHILQQNGGKFNNHFRTLEGEIFQGYVFAKSDQRTRDMILKLFSIDIYLPQQN